MMQLVASYLTSTILYIHLPVHEIYDVCSCCHLQVLLFIFTIIRRNFWDYGRLALLADYEGSVQKLPIYRSLEFF